MKNKNLINILNSYSNIIFVGGGTGGHIQPIVSIFKELNTLKNNKTYSWIGGANSQETNTAKDNHIPFFEIPTLKLSTTNSIQVVLYPLILVWGIMRAYSIIKKLKTRETVVFSKGGPGSVAIGIATWLHNIPLHIHESDTIPGRSNRILGKFADKIWLGFDSARHYFDAVKCETIGQIIDPVFTQNNASSSNPIQWTTSKPHIFVTCGSQGSRAIFESIVAQFSNSDEFEWIVALGKLNSNMKQEFLKIPNCQAIDWISQENIANLLKDTHLVISRGSATTLAEITTNQNIKLIIIPLPYSAGNHQYHNAVEYQKQGHILLEQSNLDNLFNTITTLEIHGSIGNKNQ